MYKYKSVSIPAALIFLMITSCAPDPVFRLLTHEEYSGEEDIIMHNGMQYLVSDRDSSGAVLAYYRHIGNRIVMDLEVFNYSGSVIRFDPSDVRYVARKGDFERSDNREYVRVQSDIEEGSAIDPEETMLNIDIRASREEADERTAMLLDGISGGLNLASDISNTGNLSRAEIRERENRRLRNAVHRAERRDRYYNNIASLNSQRNYWETETIRTTDIYPGESIAGEISIPLLEKANEYQIIVIIGGEEHMFRFTQKKYEP